MTTAPARSEAAEYYFTYIDQVPKGDICKLLETHGNETLALLNGISDEKSLHRYAPDKWSIRDVVNHISDSERTFTYRALFFARGFEAPLPSFDQNISVAAAGADRRSWTSLVGEFGMVRAATLTLFQSLPADAWDRRGIASDNPVTVRALAYIVAGHAIHHTRILRERYLSARPPAPG